jgi:hypothetical protein
MHRDIFRVRYRAGNACHDEGLSCFSKPEDSFDVSSFKQVTNATSHITITPLTKVSQLPIFIL